MTQTRLAEEDIFRVALEIATRETRTAYLRQACGADVALYQRIVALLKVAEEEQSFLERPAAGLVATIDAPPTIDTPSISEGPGSQIGPYKLLQVIGEGGMGVVYMAEQIHPVKRRVALKIIKPGMDTRQVVARFEAERQALSMMDHPNIAKVLDAGATSSGRPYFVMELVKGQPITQYCDEHHLTPRQRLELFLPVCQAIQHAHQKGIIHRDVKPSNVMVSEYDHEPVPKVIDFGVAKATSQTLTEKTMFTGLGQIIGTLEYMSPEQAKVNQLDIDTRSDIYSLGVLMYELLTGTTPLDRQRLRSAAFDEMLRIIREDEPPRPSTRLSTLDTLASVAANRKTEAGRLSGIVRGELDWIVMKALDKDRNRRYETANGLGMDIQRYLQDEPVQACPPSAAYRFRKLARRNKALLATGMIVAVTLLTGLAGTTWQAIRARNAERVAKESAQAASENEQKANQQRSEAIAQRDAKEKALAEEANQRQRADQERTRADEKARVAEAVNDFLINDILKANPYSGVTGEAGGTAPTLLQVVERSASQVGNRFKDQPLVEATVRSAIGCSLLEFGRLDEAAQQLEESVRIFRQAKGEEDDANSVRALQLWAYVLMMLGRLEESEKLHAEALQRAERTLPIEHETRRVAMSHYAHCLTSLGKYDVAEPLYKQCIADTLKCAGETPQLQMVRSGLANLYWNENRRDEAEQLYRQALSEHRRLESDVHPNTVNLIEHLGEILLEQGRFEEATPLFEEALAAERQSFGEVRLGRILTMLQRLEECYSQLGRWDDAEKAVQQALATIVNPSSTQATIAFSAGNSLFRAYASSGQWAKAVDLRTAILAAQRSILKPDDSRLASSLLMLGRTLLSADQPAKAEALLRESLAISEKPGHADVLYWTTMTDLATACRLQGKYTEAIELYQQVLDFQSKKLGADDPMNYPIFWYLGETHSAAGNLPEAIEAFEQAASGFEQQGFESTYAAETIRSLVNAYERMQNSELAFTWQRKWVAAVKERSGPESIEYAQELAILGLKLLLQQNWVDTEPVLRECLAIREKAQPDNWPTFNTKSMLGGSLLGQKKFDEAEPLLLAGYEGQKLREAMIPEPAKVRLNEALDRLVELYSATEKSDELKKWQTERSKYPLPPVPPTEK